MCEDDIPAVSSAPLTGGCAKKSRRIGNSKTCILDNAEIKVYFDLI